MHEDNRYCLACGRLIRHHAFGKTEDYKPEADGDCCKIARLQPNGGATWREIYAEKLRRGL